MPSSRAHVGSSFVLDAAPKDTPVNRYANPILTCGERSGNSCICASRRALDQVLLTLKEQNRLLADLLGAVNSLTAAILVRQSH